MLVMQHSGQARAHVFPHMQGRAIIPSPLVRIVCDVSGTNNIQGPSALMRGRITAISDKGFKGNSPAVLSRATVKVPGTLSNAAPLAFKSALSSLLSHEP